MNEKPQLNPLLKLALDFGPLLLFFFANSKPALFEPWIAPLIPDAVATGERAGIFVATAVFMRLVQRAAASTRSCRLRSTFSQNRASSTSELTISSPSMKAA